VGSYSLLSLKYKLVFSEALRNIINDLFFLSFAIGGESYWEADEVAAVIPWNGADKFVGDEPLTEYFTWIKFSANAIDVADLRAVT